MQLVTPWR